MIPLTYSFQMNHIPALVEIPVPVVPVHHVDRSTEPHLQLQLSMFAPLRLHGSIVARLLLQQPVAVRPRLQQSLTLRPQVH